MKNLKSLWVVLQNEPVATRAAVGAVVVLLTQFGLPIDQGLANAIDGVVGAVLVLGARNRVTPVDPAPRAGDPDPSILGKAVVGAKRAILGKA